MEEKIKVNDQFKIVFSIVKEISEDNIPKATDYDISNEKFADLLEITQEAGLIKNVKINRNGLGKVYSLVNDRAKAKLALRNYLASRDDNNPALFVSDRRPHGRMKKEAIEKRVRKLGEASGIGRRMYPHLIRHTTATDGLERGMPVEEVQQILGHVNIGTTMIYAEVCKENVKNSHRKCIV